MKFDVVLQGPVVSSLDATIYAFRLMPWLDNIILSTWEGEDTSALRDILVIKSKDPANPGIGNRNRQIVSSKAGLNYVTAPCAIKARTDQIMQDLPKMYEFYKVCSTGKNIFTLGLYKAFPFHPRDHLLMGPTILLREMFDCELDEYSGPINYDYQLRAEAWIGAQYFAKHDGRAAKMWDVWSCYLTDAAPMRDQALELDRELKPALFTPFPRIKMSWPIKGLDSYHYDVGASYSEYWSE